MLSREEALNIDIAKLKKVHLIGITSGFNSFCASYLLEKGVEVTASEFDQGSDEAKEWIEKGVLFEGGHSADYITEDLDLVVFPNAPIPGNPECERADEINIPSITIGQLTGLISKDFKVIAVAGTHGKTTTSAMVVWLLKNTFGKFHSFIIGDKISSVNISWNYDLDSEYLVIEACEYKRQFLDRTPTPYISVVTNIELDHTDYYKDLDDYRSAFIEFLSNTTDNIVIDTSSPNIQDVLKELNKNIPIIDSNDLEKQFEPFKSPLPGDHNLENFQKVCGVAKALNIEPDLHDFPGVASRFEYMGKTPEGLTIFLDYAHNPAKVKACLKEAKDLFPDKKILLVWQPHSPERTSSFKEEFAKSLDNADTVLIPNIFVHKRERQKYEGLITAEEFTTFLQSKNAKKDIRYTADFEKTKDIILDEFDNKDTVAVFASAGDLKKIFELLNLKK